MTISPNVEPVDYRATPLLDLRFVVVDVETTGCSVWGDRVTEVATVEVQGGEVGRTWSSLVYPQRAIPPPISSLTGIGDGAVRRAPPFTALADRVRLELASAVFVAHNAHFDWHFLNAELERTTGDGLAPDGARLCTVRLARVFLKKLERRSLDDLAAYYDVTIGQRHRALGDAVATAHCFTYLLEAAERLGLDTLGQLEAHIAEWRRRRYARRKRRSFLPTSFVPTHIA